MKLLVFSDSHGNVFPMREAVLRNRDADCILYLGDGLRDLEEIRREFPIPILAVRGNCDFGMEGYSEEESITLDGVRILLTHGHRYGVKGGTGAFLTYARAKGYHIALYGHTHLPHESYHGEGQPLYLMNPGSIGKRERGIYSFGVITLQSQAVLLSFGTVQ